METQMNIYLGGEVEYIVKGYCRNYRKIIIWGQKHEHVQVGIVVFINPSRNASAFHNFVLADKVLTVQ